MHPLLINNNMEDLIKYNIFAIPVGDEFGANADSCYLIYAPLANIFFIARKHEIENIHKIITEQKDADITKAILNATTLEQRNPDGCSYNAASTLYLLLNEKCNFHCKYCFSASGRSNDEMTIEQIKTSLNFFLAKDRNASNSRVVMFVGGGEPTLSWALIKQGTEYAEKIATENNIKLRLRLSTNGSILNEEILNFIKTHQIQLQLSFDVLKDVQDAQRGSFDLVDKNIKKLLSEGIHCNIRATITLDNVDRIAEMVEFCSMNYPTIDALLCEPVVDPEYFVNRERINDYFNRYFLSFKQGVNLAQKYNINLQSSSYGSVRQLRERFCYNLLCVTPFGSITTCPNVSSPKEQGYDNAVFAHIDGDNIIFDEQKYNKITKSAIKNNPKCVQCWAKFNCGGGCPNQRRVYPPEIFDVTCEHYKRTLKFYLLKELSIKYQQKYNSDMYNDIAQKLKGQ